MDAGPVDFTTLQRRTSLNDALVYPTGNFASTLLASAGPIVIPTRFSRRWARAIDSRNLTLSTLPTPHFIERWDAAFSFCWC
jgi:hypothetical protein